jgi:hypothetical protein
VVVFPVTGHTEDVVVVSVGGVVDDGGEEFAVCWSWFLWLFVVDGE